MCVCVRHQQDASPGCHLLHGVPDEVEVEGHLEAVQSEVCEVDVTIETHSRLSALLDPLPDLLHQRRL